MKLLFKQRLFSWFDSYDIYNEVGDTVYTVKGQLSWGHCLKIYDANNNEIGTVQEKVLTFFPKFEMYKGNEYIGCITKQFSFFKPKFSIDYNGWDVNGDFFEWDYSVKNAEGGLVATIAKKIMSWSDTYVLDVYDDRDAVTVLMVALAIDAEKSSRG